MKILFAVSNENISESIVDLYQKKYKEIVSSKNVYYFNAIIKELQRDHTYDRVVISEDLEPFSNTDYEAIDKFIFEKLDSISDEAIDRNGKDIPIILIGTDRRAKADQLLAKLFAIGVYDVLLGDDRSIEGICDLLKQTRTKRIAKEYYGIASEGVEYQAESEKDVSEIEIQNIITHYKKLGKDESRYVESFNNIAAQYNDDQLRVIANFLPLNVKAVLEAESPKYQSVMTFGKDTYNKANKNKAKNNDDALNIGFIETHSKNKQLSRPVIIPSTIDKKVVKKIPAQEEVSVKPQEEIQNKRGRGRPKKSVETFEKETNIMSEPLQQEKRGRGRPKKIQDTLQHTESIEKIEEPEIDLFNMASDNENYSKQNSHNTSNYNSINDNNLNYNSVNQNSFNNYTPRNNYYEENNNNETIEEINSQQNRNYGDISNLITRDKKVVAFVGTTKNGTSFLVNNLAQMISQMGIKTAILDTTKSKNSYYIYTKNEEQLRIKARESISNLRKGIPDGINVNRNLTVFTSVPNDDSSINDVENILYTLINNFSLVLIDADFYTPVDYYRNIQEIYLVQSMDILTIQPFTDFLRTLKSKNALDEEKIKIVINKEQRVRSLTEKMIVGGMAFYNDPEMSFMTELFNKDTVKYISIPYDIEVASKYLEGLVDCEISINGYPKQFIERLKALADMVYPLIANKYNAGVDYTKNNKFANNNNTFNGFSGAMNDTLLNMKKQFK